MTKTVYLVVESGKTGDDYYERPIHVFEVLSAAEEHALKMQLEQVSYNRVVSKIKEFLQHWHLDNPRPVAPKLGYTNQYHANKQYKDYTEQCSLYYQQSNAAVIEHLIGSGIEQKYIAKLSQEQKLIQWIVLNTNNYTIEEIPFN